MNATGRPVERMNTEEREYAREHLQLRQEAGDILTWGYEEFTLHLAPGVAYRPDFHIIHADGSFCFVELKSTWRKKLKRGFSYTAHWEDDSRVKFKLAAEKHPLITFLAVRKLHPDEGFGWETFEILNPGGSDA